MGAETRRYPAGTGWSGGFLVGFVVGMGTWLATGDATLGLVAFVATGTALGVAVERSLDTRALTASERRAAWILVVAGLVVGGLVWVSVALFV